MIFSVAAKVSPHCFAPVLENLKEPPRGEMTPLMWTHLFFLGYPNSQERNEAAAVECYVHVGNERRILLECWNTLWHAKKLCEVAIATKSGSRRLKLETVPSLCVCVSLSLNPGSQNLNERRKLYREFRTRYSRYVPHSPTAWIAVSTSKTETQEKEHALRIPSLTWA